MRHRKAVDSIETALWASNRRIKWRAVTRNWELYLLALIPTAYIIVFHYIPMYGAQIAFKRFIPALGIWDSPWMGLSHFQRFFNSYQFVLLMRNTIVINVYQLLAGFPIPIMLAFLLHYCPFIHYKKTVQMATYAPYFISTVVMVGILLRVLALRNGILNNIIGLVGLEPINWMGEAGLFYHVYVWSGVWQHMGWGSIIYLAALAGVDPELHEAARVDGATMMQRIVNIDIPSILPTVVILLILQSGQMLSVGFEKIFLMQNSLNIRVSEVLQTYVYKIGLAAASPNFSYAAAIGLFASVVSFTLLLVVNRIARRLGETSLW
jgi:putative aldouronate transport system permease protein